jgi:hypothetical protein
MLGEAHDAASSESIADGVRAVEQARLRALVAPGMDLLSQGTPFACRHVDSYE